MAELERLGPNRYETLAGIKQIPVSTAHTLSDTAVYELSHNKASVAKYKASKAKAEQRRFASAINPLVQQAPKNNME